MNEYGSPLPPAPRPPRKNHTALIVVLSVVGAVVMLCGLAGIMAVAGTGPTPHARSTRLTAPDGTAVPDAGTTPAAEPSTTEPAPQPTTLLATSGNGIKATTEFTTGASWSLVYTFDCSGFGSSGNFAVTEYTGTEMTDVLVNALAAYGEDTVPVYDAGLHHLEVNSECDWTMTVVG